MLDGRISISWVTPSDGITHIELAAPGQVCDLRDSIGVSSKDWDGSPIKVLAGRKPRSLCRASTGR